MSVAVRSYTGDAVTKPATATVVGTTVTCVGSVTTPAPKDTVALPSVALALPPDCGVTSPGGDGPLPGTAAGSIVAGCAGVGVELAQSEVEEEVVLPPTAVVGVVGVVALPHVATAAVVASEGVCAAAGCVVAETVVPGVAPALEPVTTVVDVVPAPVSLVVVPIAGGAVGVVAATELEPADAVVVVCDEIVAGSAGGATSPLVPDVTGADGPLEIVDPLLGGLAPALVSPVVGVVVAGVVVVGVVAVGVVVVGVVADGVVVVAVVVVVVSVGVGVVVSAADWRLRVVMASTLMERSATFVLLVAGVAFGSAGAAPDPLPEEAPAGGAAGAAGAGAADAPACAGCSEGGATPMPASVTDGGTWAAGPWYAPGVDAVGIVCCAPVVSVTTGRFAAEDAGFDLLRTCRGGRNE